MKVTCPLCRGEIASDDVNVGTDTAFCRACEEAFRLSDHVTAPGKPRERSVDPGDPPRGAWFERTFDGFRVGATTRSPMALFLVPFTMFWSGLSLGGIYGTMIASGELHPVLVLFSLPFLIGTVILVSICALTIAGKTEVTVDRGRGQVFVGVGALGRIRRFDWDEFDRVQEDRALWNMRMSFHGGGSVALEGRRRIRFGSFLSENRRYFLRETLAAMLDERD